MVKVLILKKRKDFIRVAKGLKMISSSLILQAAQSLSIAGRETPDESCFLGFTVTKKVGKAHVRNRAKRRLRAAAQQVFPELARPHTDYVLIGRYNTADIEFAKLCADMRTALKRIHKLADKESGVPSHADKAVHSAD